MTDVLLVSIISIPKGDSKRFLLYYYYYYVPRRYKKMYTPFSRMAKRHRWSTLYRITNCYFYVFSSAMIAKIRDSGAVV